MNESLSITFLEATLTIVVVVNFVAVVLIVIDIHIVHSCENVHLRSLDMQVGGFGLAGMHSHFHIKPNYC